MTKKLQISQRRMERCMVGITKGDKKRNADIRAQTKVLDIIIRDKRLKWIWTGQCGHTV